MRTEVGEGLWLAPLPRMVAAGLYGVDAVLQTQYTKREVERIIFTPFEVVLVPVRECSHEVMFWFLLLEQRRMQIEHDEEMDRIREQIGAHKVATLH